MAFKRALWHSGLTYQQTCYHCRALVRYTDYQLDFRPWYPDGFVYCPRCKGPLRHNELYAINPDGSPVYEQPVAQPAPKPAPKLSPCPNCGLLLRLRSKTLMKFSEIKLLLKPSDHSEGLFLFPVLRSVVGKFD